MAGWRKTCRVATTRLGRTLIGVRSVETSETVARDLVAEFGDDASRIAERTLRNEITRHRITRAVRAGQDPAAAVAEALANDPAFRADVDNIAQSNSREGGDLADRLRRWAV
jgi:hypothetical protein